MRAALLLLTFLAATSAHAQWTLETSNTTADLRGIHSIGNGVAWASGTRGTVLRTEDGGYVWQSCSIPPGAEKLDFRGIQAFDANTAIVMSSGPGDQSRLYKTTDGCHSWKLLFTNPDKDGFWDAISAEIPDKFLILGDPVDGHFSLFISTNGGMDWGKTRDPLGLQSEKDEGAFAASNSALLVLDPSEGTTIFGSGGPSGARAFLECVPCNSRGFGAHPVPFPKGQSAGVFSIANRGPHLLIAVGGDYTKPDSSSSTATFSSDGGLNWHGATTPPHGYRSAVAYASATKTWITVGPNGTDISTDDGRNWRALHPNPASHEAPDADRNWNALSLPFVVGPHGRIGKLDESALKH
jgi:photosystem II stability/assembly factor-like uncharacterized protein